MMMIIIILIISIIVIVLSIIKSIIITGSIRTVSFIRICNCNMYDSSMNTPIMIMAPP